MCAENVRLMGKQPTAGPSGFRETMPWSNASFDHWRFCRSAALRGVERQASDRSRPETAFSTVRSGAPYSFHALGFSMSPDLRDGGGPTQAFTAHQAVLGGNQLDPSDTPRLIRLPRARSVGVIPSIRRKVRVKCAPSENPALWAAEVTL